MILRFERSLILIACTLAFAWGPFTFAADKVRRNVEVEWEPVPDASLYEVQVIRKDGTSKKPQRFRVKVPSWSATISPGLYNMQVRSFDDRGAPGDWSPPSELLVKLPSVVQESPKSNEVVKSSDEKYEEVRLKWDEVPGAAKYKVTVHSTKTSWKEEKVVEGTDYKVSVPVGEAFAWNVNAVDSKGEEGDLNGAEVPFRVQGPPLERPKIQKPISKYVSEVNWSAPAYASTFAYELSYKDPKTGKWSKLEEKADSTDTKLTFDYSRPSGRYRLKVQAHAEGRDSSKVSQLEFETRGGFRSPAALEAAIMRDSITKPTNYYAIASYMLTQITYEGHDKDHDSYARFDAIGGTGRVGMGYQNADSNWGGFGIVDLSGFSIESQNFTFASAEAHLTHKLEFGQRGLLLAATGLFYKQLPIVLGQTAPGQTSQSFQGVGKVTMIGPHIGFVFWTPLSARLGLQFNARAYYTLFGSSSDGGKSQGSLSYLGGLLGTYRISSSWMGYAGYAYRADNARYSVVGGGSNYASSGDNTLQIQGHFLNLLLEYSF